MLRVKKACAGKELHEKSPRKKKEGARKKPAQEKGRCTKKARARKRKVHEKGPHNKALCMHNSVTDDVIKG